MYLEGLNPESSNFVYGQNMSIVSFWIIDYPFNYRSENHVNRL